MLRLNTVVIFGFESHSDITRNLLYTKGLNIKDFEYAVAKSKEYNIFSGAFIYSGFHSLAEREILVDVIKTVMYLKDLGVMPVIMLPNVREYTLVDLLYKSNRYKLIDPITALEITRITCWITADLIADHAKFDPWLMGDPLGGPPPVKNGVFTNPQRICCDECTSRIMNALQHTRKIQNPLQLYTTVDTVQNCQNHCYDKYQQFILSEVTLKSKQSIQRRVEANLTYASAHIDEYLNMMRCEVE